MASDTRRCGFRADLPVLTLSDGDLEKETAARLQQLAEQLGYSAEELIDACTELGFAYDSDVDVERLADAVDEHAARRAQPQPQPTTKVVFNGPTLFEVWLSHFRTPKHAAK